MVLTTSVVAVPKAPFLIACPLDSVLEMHVFNF